MKFEVRYPNGNVHEVELGGSLAVLGRDPSCDLVLNDTKCSRRHAVVEASAQGLSIRDSGSANGIYVNGKRVERANLNVGDEVRLGEVVVKVLPEDVPGTLVMAPDEIGEMAPPPARPSTSDSTPTVPPAEAAAPPPPPTPAPSPLPRVSTATPPPLARPPAPAAPPRPAPSASGPVRPPGYRPSAPEPLPRPLTATVLAALWLLSAVLNLFGGIIGAWLAHRAGAPMAGLLAASIFGFVVGLVLGLGLWGRHGWGRILQLIVSFFGLFTCVMTPLSALTLYYMLRRTTQIHFSGRRTFRELTEEEAALVRAAPGEGLMTGGVFVCLFLAALLAALIGFLVQYVPIAGRTSGPLS